MKGSTGSLVLVAVLSSLLTLVGAQLLDSSRSAPAGRAPLAGAAEPAPWRAANEAAGDGTLAAPRVPHADGPEAPESEAQAAASWVELERRVAALEARLAQRRAAAAHPGPAATEGQAAEEMRLRVLEWVSQDREQRRRIQEQEGLEQQRQELEFGARHRALALALEYDLEAWQQERFAELFLEIAERAQEIESGMDIRDQDPAAFEAQWRAFDEWVEQEERRLAAEVAPELYREMYGSE